MFPCNLLQGVSVAASSCTACEYALEKFELDVLGQPSVAASRMSKFNFRPVSTQSDFEEQLDPPSFTSLKGQSPVCAHCFIQLGRTMYSGSWRISSNSWLALFMQQGKCTTGEVL